MRLEFVLPPGWVWIPLHDEEARARSVERIVTEVKVDDGRGAEIRRRLREQVAGAAADAARSGASTMALSTSGVGGVPVPASLVVTFSESLPAPTAEAPWLTDESARVDTARVPAGEVVRRVRSTQTPYEQGELSTLGVDYWLSPPSGGPGGVVHLALSTPLVDFEEAMLGLFDAIVESARWRPVVEEGGAR